MINAQLNPDYELLPNGRLADISKWTPDIAAAMAKNEGLTLTDEHWAVITLMRDFYGQYNTSPVGKLLKKHIRRKLGEEFASDEHLDALFPNNVLIQGTRLAGLPVPMHDAEVDNQHQHRSSPVQRVDSGSNASVDAPHFTSQFDFNGNTIKVHSSGNLVDPSVWNEDMAIVLAEKEGISLTEEHWNVIRYLRRYYFKYGISPMVRLLTDSLREATGDDQLSKEHLYKLFPSGPSRQGSRIAGLPAPQGCID